MCVRDGGQGIKHVSFCILSYESLWIPVHPFVEEKEMNLHICGIPCAYKACESSQFKGSCFVYLNIVARKKKNSETENGLLLPCL